jgi:hypothetical protein
MDEWERYNIAEQNYAVRRTKMESTKLGQRETAAAVTRL